jgi:hypothetical protein
MYIYTLKHTKSLIFHNKMREVSYRLPLFIALSHLKHTANSFCYFLYMGIISAATAACMAASNLIIEIIAISRR